MGDEPRWKRRIPTRIYDYNYKVSEGYYKPQKNFLETRSLHREREVPPEHQSYAERFANNPWYGNTKGLPYREEYAASNDPLLKLSDRHMRSSSLLREMKDQEGEDLPLHIRARRRRKKFEEEDEVLGIRPRLGRNLSLDESLGSSSRELKQKINARIRSVDDELSRSKRNAFFADPQKWNYELDYPGKSISHKEVSHSLPSGGTVRKSSHSEVSHFHSSSSKPPLPSRMISANEELFPAIPRPRVRVSSVGDYVSLPRQRRSSAIEDDIDISPYTSKSARLREERRMRESKELTEAVTDLVEKMRTKDIDPVAAFNFTRGSRASSVDRHHSDERPRSRRGSFVYGIGRY